MKYFLIILVVLGLIMQCTIRCNSNSAIELYKKGNYEEAYEKFSGQDEFGMTPIQLYYYYLACKKTGNDTKDLKRKAFSNLYSSFNSGKKKFNKEFGDEVYAEYVLYANESDAFNAAEISIKEILKNPSSLNVLQKSIADSKTVGNKYFYLVKMRISATNSFGATVSEWYIVEVIIDSNGKKFTRNNIERFDSEPSSYGIDVCRSMFGW